MAVLIQTALNYLLEGSTKKMKAELQALVTTIRRDFEMAYSPTAVVDMGDREKKLELKKEIEELKVENEGLQEDLSEFLRKEEGSSEGTHDGSLQSVTVEVANEGEVSPGSRSSESESSECESDESD